MKKKEEPQSYTSAYEALQQIVTDLQNEKINIDELPEAIVRATELLRFCREHLRAMEGKLEME